MREAIQILMEGSSITAEGVPLSGSYKKGIAAVFRNIPLLIRSCLIAWVIGVAPGAGATVAGFVSYASAAKSCKNPENFGRGDVRGVIAGDTALHACAGGDLLPTVTLGIPGSNAMAILMSALLLHGVTPGPQIVTLRSDLIYLIIFTIFLAHVISVFMALGFSTGLEKLTKTRAEIIAPIIIVFCLVGAYMIKENWQDMMVATIFGILGYYLKKHGYHPIPLILGMILGRIAEMGLFTALEVSDNGIWIFFTRIPSLVIFLCIVLVIFWPFVQRVYKKVT
jgi:putative tricarboxylic transport membrane protein